MVRSSGWRALVGAWFALVPALAAAAGDDGVASLRPLAEGARRTLAERIEAPVAQLPYLCLLRRAEGAPMREYVLRQQAQAIDALLASATNADEARRVSRLLGELRRDAYASGAVRRLVDGAPGGAAGLRLAASLGELPAALHARMHPGCGASSYRLLLGRTDRPLGELAPADYQRLAELEPADPWHGLVLGWLAGPDAVPALQRSLAAAQAAGSADSLRVQVFAWQQMAWLLRQSGRNGDAVAAAQEAWRLARDAVGRTGTDVSRPAAEQALRDVGQTAGTLAIALEDGGRKAAAFELLAGVLPLQERLAGLRPDDLLVHYALIETLARLGTLQTAPGAASAASAPAPAYPQRSLALYRQLEQRTPYSPMLASSSWPVMFAQALVLAGLLTLLPGWGLLWLYRRRTAQLMQAAARSTGARPVAAVDAGPQALRSAPQPAAADAVPAAAAALRRAALVQVVAGSSFGIVAAWLSLRADGTEPNIVSMAVMSWTWAWPTVLALGLVWDGDRRRQHRAWAAYFVGLLLICIGVAFSETPPLQMFGMRVPPFLQGLVFWALTLSYSPFLLLFLNRSVRSIGPVLLAMTLVAACGGMVTMIAASTPVGLAALVRSASAIHLPVEWTLPAAQGAGMLAAAPLGGWVGRRLRAAYAAKWLSDQSLMIDTLWLYQALLLSFSLSHSVGAAGWLGGLGVAVLHKAITLAGMRPAARAARRRPPLRLLLLRVFDKRDARGRRLSRRAEAERLFDLLGSRWRYAGPIHLIGAPDLASSTIDPDELLDFLCGRLHERFILEPADVPARLATLDERCDFDARWRVNELFCGNDAWRAAVLALMARSDLVAMDLRDFGPDNQGCIFELQALLDQVPARRVALLVDRSTRIDFLAATIDACLARVPAGSPNAGGGARMAQVNLDGGEPAAVDQLLRLAAAVA